MEINNSTLSQQLDGYTAFDELEELHVQQLQQFLKETSNPFDRSNLLAHIVADAWIVNPQRDKVVLVEHALSKMWMAPGGHCDGDPDVFASAIREAEEETGLINLKPLLEGNILDINVGDVPTRKKDFGIEPVHLHFDVCYAFEAPDNASLMISDESTRLSWIPLNKISQISSHPTHYRRPQKTTSWLS